MPSTIAWLEMMGGAKPLLAGCGECGAVHSASAELGKTAECSTRRSLGGPSLTRTCSVSWNMSGERELRLGLSAINGFWLWCFFHRTKESGRTSVWVSFADDLGINQPPPPRDKAALYSITWHQLPVSVFLLLRAVHCSSSFSKHGPQRHREDL